MARMGDHQGALEWSVGRLGAPRPTAVRSIWCGAAHSAVHHDGRTGLADHRGGSLYRLADRMGRNACGMRRFDGRTVFVTGGAHGIGAATARRLHDEGARLVVADTDVEAADQIAAELGDGSCAVRCDITDRWSVDAAVTEAVAQCGPLHALVNVAGGSRAHAPLLDGMSDADWTDLLDLNLTGAMRCIRAVAPLLSRGGAIVLVGSVNGLAAFGDEAYSSAKAGLSVLAKNLAVRLRPAGNTI